MSEPQTAAKTGLAAIVVEARVGSRWPLKIPDAELHVEDDPGESVRYAVALNGGHVPCNRPVMTTESAETTNATLLEEWVESFNAKDVERFLSLHSDDFDYRLPRFGHAARGVAAHRETVTGFIAAVPDRAITVRQTLFQGDYAVVIYAYEGTSSGVMPGMPPANERVSLEVCAVMRFRAGKLAEQVDYS